MYMITVYTYIQCYLPMNQKHQVNTLEYRTADTSMYVLYTGSNQINEGMSSKIRPIGQSNVQGKSGESSGRSFTKQYTPLPSKTFILKMTK